MFKQRIAFCLCLSVTPIIYSAPQVLTTHNQTNYQAIAYVDGKISLPKIAEPLSDSSISWVTVNRLCYGRTVNNKCPLVIKMKGLSSYSFDLGVIYMDLNSGEITPKQITFNHIQLNAHNTGELSLQSVS